MKLKIKFTPREIFEEILKYAVIPTIDLIVEYGDRGIIIVKRKIAPYKNVWALPGLRILKGEKIDDTIERIAKQEIGIKVNPEAKNLFRQYVGFFKTEQNRQDLSTCYILKVKDNEKIKMNSDNFSSYKIIDSFPQLKFGAMYEFYLKAYYVAY